MFNKKPTREQRAQFEKKRREAIRATSLYRLYDAIQHPQTKADIGATKERISAYKKAAQASFEVAIWLSFYEPAATLRSRGFEFEMSTIFDGPLKKAFADFEGAMMRLSNHIPQNDYSQYCGRFAWNFMGLAVHLNAYALFEGFYLPQESPHGRKDRVLVAFDLAVSVFGNGYKVLKAYSEEYFEKNQRDRKKESLRKSIEQLRKRRN